MHVICKIAQLDWIVVSIFAIERLMISSLCVHQPTGNLFDHGEDRTY